MTSLSLYDMEDLSLTGEVTGDLFGHFGLDDSPDDDFLLNVKPEENPKRDPPCIHDLLSEDILHDSFGAEWMETVDLSRFLDSDLTAVNSYNCSSFEDIKLISGLFGQDSPLAEVSLLPTILNDSGFESFIDVDPEDAGTIVVPDLSQPFGHFETSVEPSIDLSLPTDVPSLPVLALYLDQTAIVDHVMASPLSQDDIDEVFSTSTSLPASPASLLSMLPEDACDQSDPDWMPSPIAQNKSTPYSRPQSPELVTYGLGKVKTASRNKTTPLCKKDKKKLQNKNAAIRYRVKKKTESDDIKSVEDNMEKTNKDLQDKVEQLSREIKYMKDLMAEVYKAKQLSKRTL